MKKVYILRHAKSSWADSSQSDFDRPLNERGENDAPFMGEKFSELGIKPDLVLSSPAKRAFNTAAIIAEKINYPFKKIEKQQNMYMAGAHKFLKIINALPDKISSVMLVAHNPGLTELLNDLAGHTTNNMPTCSLAAIEFFVDEWKAISPGSGKLTLYEYPKKYK